MSLTGRTIKRLLAITLILLFIPSVSAGNQDVIAVKSYRIKPYDEALKGFSSSCGCSIKELVASEMDEKDVIKEIRRARPKIILAIGTEALSLTGDIENIPIIYAMVPNPRSAEHKRGNISGVGMDIPPEKYLSELHKVFPKVKRIGLIYDPKKKSSYVKKALDTAQSTGITIVAKQVNKTQEFFLAITEMAGNIDLFWMLPDSTVITEETVEFLLLFSIEYRVPVVSFAEKYVDMGALMSLSINPYDYGKQAGEMARRIISGEDVKGSLLPPDKAVLSINLRTARELKLTISEEVIKRARIVGGEGP